SRIAANDITSDEYDQLSTQRREFQDGILALHKTLPRPWAGLSEGLRNDFHSDLQKKSEAALENSVVSPRPTLKEVITKSECLLFWAIVREALALVRKIEES